MVLDKTRRCSWFAFVAMAVAAFSLHPASAVPQPFAQQAQRLLEQTYAADAPGAVVLVARGDEVLLRTARGSADLEGTRALAPDRRFHIGSLTKQMVAVGILKLVETGKVSLDDPLSEVRDGRSQRRSHRPGAPPQSHLRHPRLPRHGPGGARGAAPAHRQGRPLPL